MKDSVRNADEYIATKPEWAELLEKLRSVMLACGLEETIKWGIPTYLTDGRQVAGLAAFKHHVAIWFWHGALLEDPDQVLVNAQEGKTQGLRQWRFTQLREVKVGLVRKYIKAAVANARAGKVIKPEKKKMPPLPPEMKTAFEEDPALARAFLHLTPGRQREHIEYVAEAKMASTRARRLEKSTSLIRAGKGLLDLYK